MDQAAALELMKTLGVIQGAVLDKGVDWATVFATLIGGALAVAAGVIQSFYSDARRIDHERATLKNALLAEICAVKELCEARRYLDGLRGIARGDYPGLEVKMPAELFIIYRANLSKLGLLSVHDAASIIRFYGMVEAVAQDIRTGGMLAEVSETDDPKERRQGGAEAAKLLEEALDLAAILTKDR